MGVREIKWGDGSNVVRDVKWDVKGQMGWERSKGV